MIATAFDLYDVATSTGTADGERRKAAAHVLLLARRAALVRQGCRLLAKCLLEFGTGTMDDIAPDLETPPGCDRRLLGAVPSTLARAGVAKLAGYRRSCRPERHASVLAVWELRDRAAALRWLDENPPLSELKTARQLELELNNETPTVAAAGVLSELSTH